MKNLKPGIFAVALLLGVSSPIFAQEAVASEVVEQDAKKQEITMKELPANVVENIKTSYPEAKFVSAAKHLGAEGAVEAYEVVLAQGDKELTLKYDAEGELVKK